MIAESCTFQVGPYTVQQSVRTDNPAWPVYVVFRAGKFIGKQFSRPSESDCDGLQWRSKAQAVNNKKPRDPYGYSALLMRRRRLET